MENNDEKLVNQSLFMIFKQKWFESFEKHPNITLILSIFFEFVIIFIISFLAFEYCPCSEISQNDERTDLNDNKNNNTQDGDKFKND